MPNRWIRSSPFRRVLQGAGRAALLPLVGTVIACGGGEESVPPAASESAAEDTATEQPRRIGAPSEGVAKQLEEQAEILQGTLPKGFPSDLPTYPDAKAENALSLPGTSFVTFSTQAAAEEVLSFYRETLQEKGWSVRDANAGGLVASKQARKVTVRASAAEGGGSEIALSISGG